LNGNRTWRQLGPGYTTLTLAAVALVAAVLGVKPLTVFGVPGLSFEAQATKERKQGRLHELLTAAV
jgi:hypothetical protein